MDYLYFKAALFTVESVLEFGMCTVNERGG